VRRRWILPEAARQVGCSAGTIVHLEHARRAPSVIIAVTTDVNRILAVHRLGHRPERHQLIHPTRPVPRRVLQLPARSVRRIFLVIYQATRKLPAPLTRHEAIPPHQQHPAAPSSNAISAV